MVREDDGMSEVWLSATSMAFQILTAPILSSDIWDIQIFLAELITCLFGVCWSDKEGLSLIFVVPGKTLAPFGSKIILKRGDVSDADKAISKWQFCPFPFAFVLTI